MAAKPASKRGVPDDEAEALGGRMWLYVVGYALLAAVSPGTSSTAVRGVTTLSRDWPSAFTPRKIYPPRMRSTR